MNDNQEDKINEEYINFLKKSLDKLKFDTQNPSFDESSIQGLSLGKLKSIKNPIISSKLSKSFKEDVHNSFYRSFYEIELESMEETSSLSQEIQKSSQSPLCIIDDDMEKNARSCSKDMIDFCSLTLESSYSEKFQKDQVYKNCIVVPLRTVLSKTDRNVAVVLSNECINVKNRKKSPGRIRKIELWRVFNNHEENSLTKSPISFFLISFLRGLATK